MFRSHTLFFQKEDIVDSVWMERHYRAAVRFVEAIKTIGTNKNDEVKKIVASKLARDSDWKKKPPWTDADDKRKPQKPVFRPKAESILDEANLQYDYICV